MLPLLPQLPAELDAAGDEVLWLVTATLLAATVATPVVSRLADMVGRRPMLVAAMTIMVLGSCVGVLADSLATAVTARAMQGVGLALVPVALAAVRDHLPPERVPLGMAMIGASLAVGGGLALPISGVIADHLDWRWSFGITLLVAVPLLPALLVVLPRDPWPRSGTFDLAGAGLLCSGLVCLLVGLSKGGSWGWSSRPTLACALLGAALLVVWVVVELHVEHPLIDVRVSARPRLLLLNAVSAATGVALFTNMLVSTHVLQAPVETGHGAGLDPTTTGMWMGLVALSFGVFAPVSAWAIRRLGPEAALVVGLGVMGAIYLVRCVAGSGVSVVVLGAMAVAGCTALTFAALPVLVMDAVPYRLTAAANGLNMVVRHFGTAVSSAAFGAATALAPVKVLDELYASDGAIIAMYGVAGAVSVVAAAGAVMLTVRRR